MAFFTTEAVQEYENNRSWSLHVQVLVGLIITMIGLVNIVTNVCTILSFATDRKLRIVANYYIVNLAATDLIVGISSLPFYAVYTILQWYWPFGYTFCKIWSVLDFWVCAESSLTIILISQDRLAMVRKGPRYRICETPKKALWKIGISWLLAFLLYGPAIIGYDVWRGYSTVAADDCDVEFASDFWYTLITSTIEFVTPFLVITVFNVMLYLNIRRRVKLHPVNIVHGETEASKMIIRRDKKAATNLALLVLVYFICWLPYVISTVIIAVCDTCVGEDLYEFFNWLLWLNSSLNCFLYALTNERLRRNYRKWFCWACHVYRRHVDSNVVSLNDANSESVFTVS
ncbi:hypothetical protein LSH36_474g03041 [Paralvinella palmiformis]|uniref:G-protein coupled receptors family 1 profile domain-containing protein n=1 Tax=Paralvinella palmiformis TaxID=53620 RepID=A0AAD9J9F1_9ANNE|nr:hypothetical protein LSH36_474g03041 [Paralvinella palmiformis]